jgi:GT2 family glycosyltransferase
VSVNGGSAREVERSVIIPVHNRSALTSACLDALLEHRPDATEILVVNDASSDTTPLTLSSYGDSIRVVDTPGHHGFGSACNAGAAAAQSRLLVFLNNDTIPTPGWLEELAAEADAHPDVGIVGSKLLWPDNTIQHAGVVIDPERNARHVYAGFPADHPAVSKSRDFQVVTGAAMLVRRELFEELDGFDGAFANGWEDVDLCLRARERGSRVRYCHRAVLYHLEGATRGLVFADDHPNWQLYRARWAERLKPDDVAVYAEDGLLAVDYHDRGRPEFRVAPALGLARTDGDGNRLERALAEQTLRSLELRQENNRLALAAHERPVRWRGVVPRRAPAGDATISVISWLDHDRHREFAAALNEQTLDPQRYEVLLVHGRAPDEREPHLLDGIGARRVEYLDSPRETGRAGALNRGIREARGEIVLLLADDFIPAPHLVEEHLALHESDPRENVAGIGPGTFPERVRRDPFARWLEDSGDLFGVSFTTGPYPEIAGFFYSANASLKRPFLLGDNLFDDRITLEAWDDYELGRRLFARGLEIAYLPRASAIHDHDLTLRARKKQMRRSGRAAAAFDTIYPAPHSWNTETDPSRSTIALALGAAGARSRDLLGRGAEDRAAYYRRTLEREFLRGYRSVAWSENGAAP